MGMSLSDIGIAIIGLFSGLVVGWIIIKRGRRPFKFDVSAITWSEQPIPIWKQDVSQTAFIVIHSLSVLSVAVLFLLEKDVPTDVLGSSRLTSIALWVVWMIMGSVISFSFIYPYAGQMPMAVFQNAFARGQYVGDWNCFSHYQADTTSKIIYLYAARSPDIVRVA